jgi:hypothetical protein
MPILFAYFGPETILPATSAVAALVGFLLMGGRHVIRLAVALARRILRLRLGPASILRRLLPGSRPRRLRREFLDARRAATARGPS